LNIVERDLRTHYLTLNEAVDLAQKCPLWRLISTYLHSPRGACQKRRRRRT